MKEGTLVPSFVNQPNIDSMRQEGGRCLVSERVLALLVRARGWTFRFVGGSRFVLRLANRLPGLIQGPHPEVGFSVEPIDMPRPILLGNSQP